MTNRISLLILGAILTLTVALNGCISAGHYPCDGINISAPIIAVGVQLGPCGQ